MLGNKDSSVHKARWPLLSELPPSWEAGDDESCGEGPSGDHDTGDQGSPTQLGSSHKAVCKLRAGANSQQEG